MQLAACERATHSAHHDAPAKVEKVDGSETKRITLTAKAVERLDLRTVEVVEQKVARSDTPRRVVPYSALIYDAQGATWVYTSPQPMTFLRHKVEVDYIEGVTAVLSDGPAAGTLVASVGVAELYGAEFAVGH
jgi:hypothetical protein